MRNSRVHKAIEDGRLTQALDGLSVLLRTHSFRIASACVLAGSVISVKWDLDWLDAGVLVFALGLALGPDALRAASEVCLAPIPDARRSPTGNGKDGSVVGLGLLVGCLGTMILGAIMFVPRILAGL